MAEAWKPIESAPKGGQPITLAWAPNGLPPEYTARTTGWDGHGWPGAFGYYTSPTHWRYE